MKTVYIGKEGSGKTLLMGADTNWIVKRNSKLFDKTGIVRPIRSNIAYSVEFEEYARSKNVDIFYWKNIEELETFSECDLFIDEVGAYFDSRTFADLPLSTRLWLAQAQKLGVHIYAGAQDWGQIDVSFRRLVGKLYELKKVIGSRRPSKTMPSGKLPWAVILSYKVAPAASSDSAELKTLSILPGLFFAGRKQFDRFDTNARITTSEYAPLQKIVRHWYDADGKIGYTRTVYR
jgi:hypothetical protein